MKLYASHRNPVYAKNGMAATSEPQASHVGLDILKQGGNAIDAAIAMAACLTVTEPTSNGIGGDNFAIVYFNDELHGMNSSGFCPKKLSLKDLNGSEIPRFGVVPITVPGAVNGWVSLHKKFGKLDFYDVLKPAINYARHGFVVGETVAKYWKIAHQIYEKTLVDPVYKPWFDTFTRDGKIPTKGDIWTLPDHADTLEKIALSYGSSFYEGELADQIEHYISLHHGFLSKDDLKSFQTDWVTPIKTNYRGVDVYEIPPNGQGLVALMGLNILENFSFNQKESIKTYHHQLEATKLAFADGHAFISDEHSMPYKSSVLLSKAYAKERSRLIKKDAMTPLSGTPQSSGTVYLATADHEGNMVSMIQSNYMGFGSGIVIPHTGIALHNRGHNFSIDPQSPNVLAPLKRPFHTIIPGFMIKEDEYMGPFGVMGGFMQPQGHIQVMMNLVDFKLNPQQALDAPRWQWMKDKFITVEPDFNKRILKSLINRGHDVAIDHNLGSFGRGQIILYDIHKHSYIGGTEKRCDGTISSY
ncbi:MAG: gamma-glutamyltransferase family protein [Acholeplasmataceae bacterium]|jgi:gamma-glutamyltranspeptidase/glutathione hydrolase|nr:gamma-glutamyltransferase family protein [Acholeplasmataceae bacterium]